MKITHEDDLWVIESTSGRTFLTEREVYELSREVFGELLWGEVEMRWDEDSHWSDILAAKDKIVDALFIIIDDIDGDTVFEAVNQFVDLN
ncbi:hypothetical protein NBH08_27930 [Faecalicatena sp. BF-R-105]|nr:hypothetical protein [Faecalicatena sp. BF-R-105]